MAEEEAEFGDIIIYKESRRRVALYDSKGRLLAFNKEGMCVGVVHAQERTITCYKKTGQNIFKDNPLNLDA